MNKIILPCALLLSFLIAPLSAEPSLKSSLASKKLLTDIVKVEDTLISVGERGHILYSNDGSNWTQANVPVNVLLTDVFFLNKQLGWAVGHDATILATTDGGINWSIQKNAPELDKPLFSIYFKDADNGIAVGAYGMFFRTNDGGKTWNSEFHDEFLHPDDQAYLNELKAEDPQAYEDETQFMLPHFNRVAVDGERLFLAGEVGLVAVSSDFGDKWQRAEAFYNGSFFDVAVNGGQKLLLGGLRGNLFTSQDGGVTWQKVNIDGTTSINRIVKGNNNVIVLLGNSGLLQLSKDGGKTFLSMTQSDGKAITGGVFLGDKLVMSSEVGIKVIESAQGGQ